jgi:hypothetical protein
MQRPAVLDQIPAAPANQNGVAVRAISPKAVARGTEPLEHLSSASTSLRKSAAIDAPSLWPPRCC